MYDTGMELLSNLLGDAAEIMDIPQHLQIAAEEQYQSVGAFLSDREDLGDGSWDIYPQGSFRLGTVVRPSGRTEFDLDLVCLRGLDKDSTSKVELRDDVGNALNKYVAEHGGANGAPLLCRPSRRCWTLEYEHAFHMDVLPAIPKSGTLSGIWLTDKELFHWQESNPIAYANWFRQCMEKELLVRKSLIASGRKLEEIPDWEVKTTLQRVVQLMKIHRDVHFQDNLDARPPSIIITTLAARAYQGERQLAEAVIEIAERMGGLVEYVDGKWQVLNPVANENFADKWNENPDRPTKFAAWLKKLEQDLATSLEARGLEVVKSIVASGFGMQLADEAVRKTAQRYRTTKEAGKLSMAVASGVLTASTGTRVPSKQGFFGRLEDK